MRKIGLVVAGAFIFGGLMLVREEMSGTEMAGIVVRALLAGMAAFILCLVFLLAQREADGTNTPAPAETAHPGHSHEQMLHDAYAAFGAGNMDGYLAYCTDDIVFHVPGHNQLAGEHTRDEFFGTVLPQIMHLTNGTFHEEVLDVLAHDDRAAVFVTHEFERDSEAIHYASIHVYRIEDGKLAEFTEYPHDQYLFDHAWRVEPAAVSAEMAAVSAEPAGVSPGTA